MLKKNKKFDNTKQFEAGKITGPKDSQWLPELKPR
jgi:hypothetical protein